jgi:microcystin-dependent protein
LTLLTALLLSIALSPTATAVEGAPGLIDYQGFVSDDQGTPLAPTTPTLYKMEFRIWDQIGNGTLIWSEAQTVTVSKGQFSVRLGEGTATTGDTVPPKVPQNQLPLAFEGSSRFLGVTVVSKATSTAGVQPVINKNEITPRLAFLTTPYAHVANTASRVVQKVGSSSSLMISGIGYATRVENAGSATVNLTLDQRTNLIAAGPTGTIANLPANGDNHELLISKTDDTPQFVTIAPPLGGQINGSAFSIRLKVKGESVTLQNAGGNDWWIVDHTRDNTPVGTIVTYGGQEPPPGYLPCNGSTVVRADYAELDAAIGTTWGPAGATLTLPSLTGRLLRGASSTLTVGTLQGDLMRDHAHVIKDASHTHGASGGKLTMGIATSPAKDDGGGANPSYGPGGSESPLKITPSASLSVSSSTSGLTVDAFGGKETRPDNAGVRYCIKY